MQSQDPANLEGVELIGRSDRNSSEALGPEGDGSIRSTKAFASRQALDRYIGFITAIAFAANLQGSWESAAISFRAGLYNGGPTSLVWGTLVSWVGSTALAASLGEMASIDPTVGAQYRWTSLYAPPLVLGPAFWGLLQGWITLFAWIATCARPAVLLATLIQGLIWFFNTDYIYKAWHTTLLAWAMFIIPVVANVFGRKALVPLTLVGGVTHLVFFIVFVATLAALAPRSTPEFVFNTSLFASTGWSSQGVQWCIGLVSVVAPLGGFDGVLHMSDEVKDPEKKVPLSMLYGIMINGATTFFFMITLMFCLGVPADAFVDPTGYPIISIIYNATGSEAVTVVFCSFLIFNAMIAMFSSLASASRVNLAFAGHHGLPFPKFFGSVNPTFQIPLNSLLLVATIIILLQLIYMGSPVAIFAIISYSTIGLYLSYVLPVIFFTLAKLRGDNIAYGPFKMGRFGLVVNIFAIIYGIFILIWLPFPPNLQVNEVNMNYAGPILGAVLIFAVADWLITGRKRFTVPTGKARYY